MATQNTAPIIDIVFKQLAVSAVTRSSKGRVGLIIRDATAKAYVKTYYSITDIENNKFTPSNEQSIKDCFIGNPLSVTVISQDTTGVFADALKIAQGLTLDWIGTTNIQTEQDALSSWVKSQEALKKTYKSIVFNPTTAPDCKHVVQLANSKITFNDSRGEQTGEKYIPTLLGIFAGLPLNKSATYYTLPNIKSVVDEANINTSIQSGKLVLFNSGVDEVKINTPVNSLTTIDANNTNDMSLIEIVEAMDLIYTDIFQTFQNDYIGKYKNKYDYQVLFISAVNSYLSALENEDILDNNYKNKVDIDIESQRKAWLGVGKTEAVNWDEATVRNNTFKNTIFLNGDIKMLQAIANLKFNVFMF
jgi:hypothetical protein